ncbi:hypothetical protein HELRODRAFT_179510 [Helobdella robusta]|uniref:Uncharacterized protein n=1 Tax=Helobdella robusta TaxID=6412 RepID=T1FET6_HELRO|nr:hypothetical protein HELRODRAFT_179510 [Helobdella robusta]ESN95434.1 hypothetical protein HELRODRAFT_179510 [Helobdella robusta]
MGFSRTEIINSISMHLYDDILATYLLLGIKLDNSSSYTWSNISLGRSNTTINPSTKNSNLLSAGINRVLNPGTIRTPSHPATVALTEEADSKTNNANDINFNKFNKETKQVVPASPYKNRNAGFFDQIIVPDHKPQPQTKGLFSRFRSHNNNNNNLQHQHQQQQLQQQQYLQQQQQQLQHYHQQQHKDEKHCLFTVGEGSVITNNASNNNNINYNNYNINNNNYVYDNYSRNSKFVAPENQKSVLPLNSGRRQGSFDNALVKEGTPEAEPFTRITSFRMPTSNSAHQHANFVVGAGSSDIDVLAGDKMKSYEESSIGDRNKGSATFRPVPAIRLTKKLDNRIVMESSIECDSDDVSKNKKEIMNNSDMDELVEDDLAPAKTYVSVVFTFFLFWHHLFCLSFF